jgi:small subunit ribosomal protein S16
MVVVRLARGGAKKNPFYKIVVADSRRHASTGKFLEQVGFYNPTARGSEEKLRLDVAKVEEWAAKGAQISPRVKTLVKEAKKAQA